MIYENFCFLRDSISSSACRIRRSIRLRERLIIWMSQLGISWRHIFSPTKKHPFLSGGSVLIINSFSKSQQHQNIFLQIRPPYRSSLENVNKSASQKTFGFGPGMISVSITGAAGMGTAEAIQWSVQNPVEVYIFVWSGFVKQIVDLIDVRMSYSSNLAFQPKMMIDFIRKCPINRNI